MIEEFGKNELVESVKLLKENSEQFREMVEEASTDEEKQSDEYKQLMNENEDIDKSLEKVITDEEREEIKKLGEIQTYIQKLELMIDDETINPVVKKRAEKQIYMIKGSYTLEPLFDSHNRPTMRPKKLKEDFVLLKRRAEAKMKKNLRFRFYSAVGIERCIRSVLPEELKNKAKVVSAYIYAVINTISLKPEGYAIFIFFLIKNINNIDKSFNEKEELVSNLIKLAESL